MTSSSRERRQSRRQLQDQGQGPRGKIWLFHWSKAADWVAVQVQMFMHRQTLTPATQLMSLGQPHCCICWHAWYMLLSSESVSSAQQGGAGLKPLAPSRDQQASARPAEVNPGLQVCPSHRQLWRSCRAPKHTCTRVHRPGSGRLPANQRRLWAAHR